MKAKSRLAAVVANVRLALRFCLGAVLFAVCMHLPFAWWGREGGWLRWALPFIGCYAYCPRPLPWMTWR